jgi:hypothetical protein
MIIYNVIYIIFVAYNSIRSGNFELKIHSIYIKKLEDFRKTEECVLNSTTWHNIINSSFLLLVYTPMLRAKIIEYRTPHRHIVALASI